MRWSARAAGGTWVASGSEYHKDLKSRSLFPALGGFYYSPGSTELLQAGCRASRGDWPHILPIFLFVVPDLLVSPLCSLSGNRYLRCVMQQSVDCAPVYVGEKRHGATGVGTPRTVGTSAAP